MILKRKITAICLIICMLFSMQGIAFASVAETPLITTADLSGAEMLEETPANAARVFVTISDAGKIPTSKSGIFMAQAEVWATDRNGDGVLTIDEALYAAHEQYFEGGAEKGYRSYASEYGLSLSLLWGNSSGVYGYYRNNESANSLADEIHAGDYITAYAFADVIGWSDRYSFFNTQTLHVQCGENALLTLYATAYDADWNEISAPFVGAKVSVLEDENVETVTNENGEAVLSFKKSGVYTVYATAENAVVPAVCRIFVDAPPVLMAGVPSETAKTVSAGTDFLLNLQEIFVGSTGGELQFYVRVNEAEAELCSESYVFTPETAGEYKLVFTAASGELISEESYTVYLSVTDESSLVSVSVEMNAVSPEMILTDENGAAIEIGEPQNRTYQFQVNPGNYILQAIDKDGVTSNGTAGITITENAQNFSVYTVTAYCSASGWTYGTDFTFENLSVISKEGEQRKNTSFGTLASKPERKTFPVLKGDSYSFLFSPAESRSEYASALQSGTVTSNATKSVSPAQKAALSITIPYADENADGVNDYSLEAGTLRAYFVYSYLECVEKERTGETETYLFDAAKGTSYFYRVSNPVDSDAVTYGNFVSVSADTHCDVTEEQMYVGKDIHKNSVVHDLSVNPYDVADIYLNVNEKGYLNLNAGQTFILYPLRNWLAIEGISNAKVIEPDFHCEVVDLEGSGAVSVAENLENTSAKHSFQITANHAGTALVLVRYDAMTNGQGMNAARPQSADRTFFSACWPENTGVFVVTVGAENGMETGMLLNPGRNDAITKLSADYIDAEHDVLYYTGSSGAEYTFTPEEGAAVECLSPVFCDGKVRYNADFSTEKVQRNADGSCTVSGLTSGSHILRLTKGRLVDYQVIRAKQMDYSISYARDGEPIEKDELKAGDTVTIAFNRVYHPANKLSGYYNNSAQIYYMGEDGTALKGTANQYLFAATEDAQTLTFTIPRFWTKSSYHLTDGSLLVSGFSSAFGAHRSVSYETGKSPDFTAVSNTSYFGSLPDITLELAQTDFGSGKLCITNSAGTPVAFNRVVLQDSMGNPVSVDENGNFAALEGSYHYAVFAAGYQYKTGEFSVVKDGENQISVVLDAAAPNAWDGISEQEPKTEEINGENWYIISNGAELFWLSKAVESGKTDILAYLSGNMDLAGYPWTPIGSSVKAFNGVLDGKGYSISNLYMQADTAMAGLFGQISGGTVENLSVDGKICTTMGSAGGIVGYLNAGTAASPSKLYNCISHVNIEFNGSGKKDFGGIAGYARGIAAAPTVIEKCAYAGKIQAENGSEVGGICGYLMSGSVQLINCYVTGDISAQAQTGGLVGKLSGTSSSQHVLKNAYFAGKVSGTKDTGAICGAYNDKFILENVYYAEGTDSALGEAKTTEEMQSEAFSGLLGAAFEADKYGINQGFPVFKTQNYKTVTLSVYDYTAVDAKIAGASQTGVILENAALEVPVSYTAEETIQAILEKNGVSHNISDGYVSQINGLGAGEGYSGWCLAYNGDDYANLGMKTLQLKNGDALRLDYSCNFDTQTDDIGNGWYGLPIVSKFTLAGKTVTLSKECSYTDGALKVEYFISGNQGGKYEIQGNGTVQDPFVIPVTVPYGTEITKACAEIETSLNPHYQVINGLENEQDFSKDVLFSVSSLGGKYQSHYKVCVTVAPKGDEGGSSSGDSVKVTFRLIGATLAEKDVNLKLGDAGYYGSEYVTWIKTKSYTMEKGATVYELFKKAAKDAGISYVDADSYIQQITAPKACGSYDLEEMQNGAYSGWMFMVNGKHPTGSMKEEVLKNGDKVIWHYTNDYRYEISDWSGSPDSPALGDGTYENMFLKAKDVNPVKDSSNTPGGTGGKPDTSKPSVSVTEPVKPPVQKKSFEDVAQTAWYHEAVQFVFEKGYMQGVSDSLFQPDGEMTRAMLVTVLYRAAGNPSVAKKSGFKDVEPGSWYENAVDWANANEIVLGYNAEQFGSEDTISREQIALMLWRYAAYLKQNVSETADLSEYADEAEISSFAKEALGWAVKNGLITGVSQTQLAPQENATRAQIAAILMRFAALTALVK